MLLSLIEALAVTSALSADAFVSAFALGADKTKVPFTHCLLISLICTAFLAVALLAGELISLILPEHAAVWGGFIMFLALGIFKLLKRPPPKESGRVSASPAARLSAPQAAILAVGLSLDGLAAGFGAGLAAPDYAAVIIFSPLIGVAAIMLGSLAGRKAAAKIRFSLTWLSGAALIGVAFAQLI